MSEVRKLFEGAAGDEPIGFDHRDVAARVERRRRRQRMLPAAALVVVALLGAAAWWSLDAGDGRAVVSGTSDPGVDELTGDRWVAFALGTVTSVEGRPWIEFDTDGTLEGYDGCALFNGDWTITDATLAARTELTFPSMPDCPGPGTGLRDLLDDGALVGRPPEVDDQLDLVPADPDIGGVDRPLGITFRRFDRLGEVPTEADLVGTWRTDGGDLGEISVTFEADGTVRTRSSQCDATASWRLDGEVLELGEGRGSGCVLIIQSDPLSRARMATDADDGRMLHLSDGFGVTSFDRDT